MERTAPHLGTAQPLPGYSPDPLVLGRDRRLMGTSGLGRLAARGHGSPAQRRAYDASLTRLQTLAEQYGVGAGELEDMHHADPAMTEPESAQYLSDKASSAQPPTWEDWLRENAASDPERAAAIQRLSDEFVLKPGWPPDRSFDPYGPGADERDDLPALLGPRPK